MNKNTLKRLTTLWVAIANDFGVNQRSIATFERRAEGAGIPFLTIDMPQLGKAVDLSLSMDHFSIDGRFKKRSKKTVLPAFLNELFVKVYEEDGYLRQDCDPRDVKNLRQLLLMFKKFEMPIDDREVAVAVSKFKDVDRSVKTSSFPWYLPVVRKHFEQLFPHDPLDIRGHHSSGQTADRVTNKQKRAKRRYIPSLHNIFNMDMHFQHATHLKWYVQTKSVVTAEPISRLAFVPKDSGGPRTICMEPHERMFVQKGLQQKIYEFTESMSPAKGYINFTDQTINRRLAQEASYTRKYCTIDLKDASDLVSWELVQQLLRNRPDWLEALRASRSASVGYEGEVINLNKFAPMGSALCFPVEAFVFWSIIRPLTNEVWVYGDDLILPTNLAGIAISRLEQFGLVVNHSKSLFKGSFRESCGGEYLHGHDIGIVKLKSLLPVNFVAFANNFREAYGEVADILVSQFEQCSETQVLRSPLSESGRPRPFVYYTRGVAATGTFFKRRYNQKLQRHELRVQSISTGDTDKSTLDDYDAYFDWLTLHCADASPEDAHENRILQREWGLLEPRSRARIVDDAKASTQTWSINTRTKFMWVSEEILV